MILFSIQIPLNTIYLFFSHTFFKLQREQNFYGAGDVTRKPKPINPLSESSLYSPMPMFAYSSPKNPIGVMPFQPKGENWKINQCEFNSNKN